MRWQRSITGLLDRWSDQIDPFGHELRELGPFVHPVVQIGHDLVDVERPTFYGYPHSVGVAGQASSVALEAGTLTLEVLSIVVSVAVADRVGLITRADTGVLFTGNLTPPTAIFSTDEANAPLNLRETPGGSGTRVMRGNPAWGAAAGLQLAALAPVELLNRGPIFLPPGQRVAVGVQGVNVAVSAAFAWRELAA